MTFNILVALQIFNFRKKWKPGNV